MPGFGCCSGFTETQHSFPFGPPFSCPSCDFSLISGLENRYVIICLCGMSYTKFAFQAPLRSRSFPATPPGLSPPTRDVGQISIEVGWACGLGQLENARETHQVCEEANHSLPPKSLRFLLSSPAANDYTSLGPNVIAYAPPAPHCDARTWRIPPNPRN